jgi:hypothetical protein
VTLEFDQPPVGIISPSNHLSQGFSVFATQILQKLATFADSSKTLGVALDRFRRGPKFTSEIVDLGLCVSEPSHNAGKERSVTKCGKSPADCVGCSPVGAERIEREAGRITEAASISEQFGFGPKFCVLFDVFESGGNEFLDLEAE